MPKAPWPVSFLFKNPPLFSLFAKETPSFIIFQNKSFPHINISLNKPLTFLKMTRINSKIPNKTLPSKE